MQKFDKLFPSLCALFCALVLLSNLIYQKFILIKLSFIESFSISSGALLYPITYMINDIIAEFYGKARSKFCIILSVFVNIISLSIISLVDYMPASYWSKVTNEEFHHIFGFYGVAFCGSLIAFFISQNLDIFIYLHLKKITRDKFIMLRNIVSTSASLLVDTVIVIGFMYYFGAIPRDQFILLIFHSFIWKFIFTIIASPLFYVSLRLIKMYN
ncbi:MAG: queuosine precursor transporter [Rickettsiaceae bacterium]|nr:queuosine precursor transporter [Rickettsiaceae bacterium]